MKNMKIAFGQTVAIVILLIAFYAVMKGSLEYGIYSIGGAVIAAMVFGSSKEFMAIPAILLMGGIIAAVVYGGLGVLSQKEAIVMLGLSGALTLTYLSVNKVVKDFDEKYAPPKRGATKNRH